VTKAYGWTPCRPPADAIGSERSVPSGRACIEAVLPDAEGAAVTALGDTGAVAVVTSAHAPCRQWTCPAECRDDVSR
jgi:hypothetical protein